MNELLGIAAILAAWALVIAAHGYANRKER